MFKKLQSYKVDRLSILTYGQSGVGKTTLASTLPGKVLIVNAENGLLSISDKDMDVYDLTCDKDGNNLDRAMRFEKLIYLLKEVLPKMNDKYDWLVFDSLTEIAQNLVECLKKKYPDRSDALKLWGEYSDSMTGLVKSLRDYRPYNILLLSLDSVEKDEAGRRFIGIDVNGKVSARIPALFDEVFYLKDFEDDEGVKKKVLITSSYQGVVAKDRSGKLDQFEKADLTNVVAKIRS